MKKLLVFNFKMAPASLAEAKKLFLIFQKYSAQAKKKQIIVIPPYVYLSEAAQMLKNYCDWGAQDVFWFNRHSATGEISPQMLKSLGAEYVIVGHSERREYFQETDEVVNLKIKACLANHLAPILCVGEKERKNKESASSFRIKNAIFSQLNYALRGVILKSSADLVVAYEPLWAIGTERAEDPLEAAEVMALIRFWFARRFSEKIARGMRIIYGGSVNGQNVSAFLSTPHINGVLVGRAGANRAELTKFLSKITNI